MKQKPAVVQSTSLVKAEQEAQTAIATVDTSYQGIDRVLTNEEIDSVKAIRLTIKDVEKDQKEKYKDWTDNLKAQIKKFDAVFKPRFKALEEYDTHLEHLLQITSAKQRELAEKKAEKTAKRLEVKGDVGQAIAVKEKAAETVIEGGILEKKARVVSMREFLYAIADRNLPDSLVKVNDGELNRLAKTVDSIPGCEIYQEERFSRR